MEVGRHDRICSVIVLIVMVFLPFLNASKITLIISPSQSGNERFDSIWESVANTVTIGLVWFPATHGSIPSSIDTMGVQCCTEKRVHSDETSSVGSEVLGDIRI